MHFIASNRIPVLLLFLVIAGISTQCQNRSSSIDTPSRLFAPVARSSVRPDSVWSVSLANLPKDRFAFSPLDTDRVWMLGAMRDPYQINLKTGEYSSLISLIGPWSKQVLDDNWAADPLDPNILWFVTFREGLVRFHRDTRRFEQIPSPGQGVVSIAFLGDQIWVGRTDGLARYDRLSGKLVKDSVFISGWTSSIFTVGDSLISNYERYYHPASGRSGYWSPFGDNSSCEPFRLFMRTQGLTLASRGGQQNWIINHRTGSIFRRGQEFSLVGERLGICYPEIWMPFQNGLKYLDAETGFLYQYELPEMKYSNTQRIVVNHDWVWVQRDRDLLCFQKSDTSLYVLPERWHKNLRQIECDDYNLYLLFEDRFEVVNIKWLITQGTPLRDQAQEEAALRTALEEMHRMGDFYLKEKRFYEILAQFSHSRYQPIQTMLAQEQEYFYVYFNNGTDSIMLFMERAIKERHFSLKDETLVHFGLYNFYGREGLLDKAAYHAGQIDSSLLTGRYHSEFAYSLPKLSDAKRRLDSLYQLKLPPDAQLFGEGKILYDYCISGLEWFSGEANYHVDLSLKKYDTLLKKYPRSTWADNATYETIKALERGSHEGGDNSYNLEACQLYQQLLIKYPTTELKPLIWTEIVSLSLEAQLPEGEHRLKYMVQSAALLDSIRVHFPAVASTDSFSELNRLVTACREANAWDISYSAKNPYIRAGQAVIITVRLKNKDTRTHKLNLSEPHNTAQFSVYYLSDNACQPVLWPFRELKNEQLAPQRNVEVPPGKSVQFDVELTRRVLSDGKIVRYNFDKPGIYTISGSIGQAVWGDAAYEVNEPLQQVQITVE